MQVEDVFAYCDANCPAVQAAGGFSLVGLSTDRLMGESTGCCLCSHPLVGYGTPRPGYAVGIVCKTT